MEKRGRRIGFSKCLNPAAWVRAFKCNSVYITCYQSMRIPVSIRTSYTMADKKALCHVRPCDLSDQRTCAVTSSGNSRRTSRSYHYVREVTHLPGQFRAEEGQLGIP